MKINLDVVLEKIKASFVLFVLTTLPGTVSAQTELLTNGSFEIGGAQDFSTSTVGWGALTGGAAYTGSDFGVAQSTPHTLDVAELGNYYAWFHAQSNVTDCIGQTVNTVIGQKYAIRFWLATDGPSTNAVFSAVWGPSYYYDPDNIYFVYSTPSATAAMPWQEYSYVMIASNTTTVLAFHAYDQSANVLLDNVSIQPLAPPPLGIVRTGTNVILTWTNSQSGFTLQSTTNLISKSTWTNVTSSPVIVNGQYTVTNAISSKQKFYRLN